MTAHFVDEHNGLQTTIAAMKKFKKVACVQEDGLLVFCNVSEHKVFRKLIKTSGAITALGHAVQHFPNEKDLQKLANETLRNVAAP